MSERLTPDQVTAALDGLPGWATDGDRAIRKTFQFRDHIVAMSFVNRVAMAAEVLGHHPELSIVYSAVAIRLTTHDIRGVTALDIELAGKIEHYA